MDVIDLKILKILQENSRTTSTQISRSVLLSVPAVTERIRKLEEKKIIKKFTLSLNRKKLGQNILAFVFVGINGAEHLSRFKELMTASTWVLECYKIAGEYDFLLKVAAEDTEKLEIYTSHILKKAAGVAKLNTVVVLSTHKEEM